MLPNHLLASRSFKQGFSYLNPRSLLLFTTFFLTACSSTTNDNISQSTHSHGGNSHSHLESAKTTPSTSQINLSQFNRSAMVKEPEVVSCTLENGDKAECAKLVVKYLPDNIAIGPFCPDTLSDEGGIWKWDGDEEGLYRVDETFLRMLDAQGYSFYDEDGKVHITNNATTPPEYDHSCINVVADKKVTMTLLIPTEPVMADEVSNLGVVSKVGISVSGVPIFSDAPSVLETGHMPVLDTCSGHVDPGGWYHYHGTASDIDTVYDHEDVTAGCNLSQSSSALFGYAFDGFGIYGSTDENGKTPTDLDTCHGHVGYVPGKPKELYHYHASKDFPNLPECLVGVVAKNNFSTTAEAGVGAAQSDRNGPPSSGPQGQSKEGQQQGMQSQNGQQGTPPGFDDAAEKLGISTEALLNAMQEAGGPRADLANVAKALGITEAELKAALPEPPGRQRN
ncbi:MAG: YHYH protein [Marinomonas colpomeniae]